MKKILKEDLSWKILSLVLAVVLWLFVINTQNPTQPQTIRNIPVTIKGLDELEAQGYVLKNEEAIKNQAFTVTIRGPRLEVDKVYNNHLITATLNLTQYTSDLTQDSMQYLANYTINILLDGHSITVTDKKPQYTTIVLEREAVVTQTVEYQIMEGSTDDYKLLGNPIISPTEIEIKGAQSAINEINSAVVHIDGNEFSEEKLVQRLPVTIYDKEGNKIDGLATSPQTVEVRLLIGKFKEVPLKVNVTGKPQEGYLNTSVKCNQQTVTIVGKPEVVNTIDEIELEPIDISQYTETTTVQGKLQLPEGVTTNNTKAISVVVEMDKENTYIYTVPVNKLNIEVTGLENGLEYEILTQEVQLGILATAQEIANYSEAKIAENLTGTLDLSDYTEGKYTVPLKLQVKGELNIIKDVLDIEVQLTSRIEDEEASNIIEDTTITEETTEPSDSNETENLETENLEVDNIIESENE